MASTTLPVCRPSRQWWLLQECRFLAQADSVEQAYTVGLCLKPAVLSKPSLSVHGSSRLCWSSHHCRLVSRTDSVVFSNTTGLDFKPTVMAQPTLPAHVMNRQCPLYHHCRFCANRQWSPFRILLFYNLFYFIFWWNQVSLYIRYIDDRSINIKHYKCYGYRWNVPMKLSIPWNKKEITIV